MIWRISLVEQADGDLSWPAARWLKRRTLNKKAAHSMAMARSWGGDGTLFRARGRGRKIFLIA